MTVNFRDIFLFFLGPENAYKCALWCFGEGFENIKGCHIWKRWNDLHGSQMQLSGDSDPNQDIPKMIELWQMEVDADKIRQDSLRQKNEIND